MEKGEVCFIKIVYSSDLHSNRELYIALRSLTHSNAADLVIFGGDLLAYSHEIGEQMNFVERFLLDYMRSYEIPILITPGNTGWPSAISKLSIVDSVKILDIGSNYRWDTSLLFEGYPYTNCSPFRNKSYERRDLINDDFVIPSDLCCYVTDMNGVPRTVEEDYFFSVPSMEEDLRDNFSSSSIWVMHSPPYNTKLDLTKDSVNIGSKAIRNAIDDKQPMLTLHGHVHESPVVSGSWIDQIGSTISINPGTGNTLHAVTISLDEASHIKNIEHSVYGTYG